MDKLIDKETKHKLKELKIERELLYKKIKENKNDHISNSFAWNIAIQHMREKGIL